MWVSRDSVNDDGGVVLARTTYLDCLCAIINDYHLLEIDLALKVFATLQNITTHLLPLLHLVT